MLDELFDNKFFVLVRLIYKRNKAKILNLNNFFKEDNLIDIKLIYIVII